MTDKQMQVDLRLSYVSLPQDHTPLLTRLFVPSFDWKKRIYRYSDHKIYMEVIDSTRAVVEWVSAAIGDDKKVVTGYVKDA